METIMPHTPIKEYELKQHSPIIHFQYDQNNATLRATDLKPRLDELLDNKGHKKRYKLRIINEGDHVKKTRPHSMYFGKLKKSNAMLFFDNVKLQVNTFFNKTLAMEIEQALPICFAYNNFGARKSKGFGSFFVKNTSIEQIYKNNKCKHAVYCFDKNPAWEAFDQIDALYKAMKPGVNVDGFYNKSLLWKFFHNEYNLFNWEKRLLKLNIINRSIDLKEMKNFYIRGLLGLANNYFFKDLIETQLDSEYSDNEIFKLKNGPANFKVTHKNNKIKRFESPVTFKPINDKIYIILRNEHFDFYPNFKTKKNYAYLKKLWLTIPKDFSLEKFMNFVCIEINENNFMNSNSSTANILKNMNIYRIN
jgi:hypothetical protein